VVCDAKGDIGPGEVGIGSVDREDVNVDGEVGVVAFGVPVTLVPGKNEGAVSLEAPVDDKASVRDVEPPGAPEKDVEASEVPGEDVEDNAETGAGVSPIFKVFE